MTEETGFEARMSATDALLWNIEKDPLLRSTITSVALLDRAPDREHLRRRVERATRVIPRLRQRVVGQPYSIAPPRWELDPNFDLDFHLRWVSTVGPGTLRDLLDIAEPIAMQGFDRARPLWEFLVVEDLEGGRAALIQKIHHAITDGVGAIRLQLEMVDLEREPDEDADRELPPLPASDNLGQLGRMVDALAYETRRQTRQATGAAGAIVGNAVNAVGDPMGIASKLARLAGSTARLIRPVNAPLSPLMRDRSLSVRFDTLTFDLGQMKRAASAVDGRLNDAFVASVIGGLHHYHEQHGVDIDQLRMTMPINIRTGESDHQAGNYWVPARFPVPVAIADPLSRLRAIRELVLHERAEPALAFTDSIASVLNRLPTTVTTAVFGGMLKGIDFITSNVPGPDFSVYVAGARVESQFAFGPMAGSATNVVLLSYLDDVNLGINSDPAAIPDPDVFVECMREGFEEIAKLA